MRANVLYANGVLRKHGRRPAVQTAPHPIALGKVAYARGLKVAGVTRTFEKSLATTFTLDPDQLGVLRAA